MSDKKNNIVIKKVKKGGHAPHGGAWKVAYADFVTAMMAFFLLLWLLTATPVENLKGLADYFAPTIGLQGKMGIGFRGGQAPDNEGVSSGDWAKQGLVFGSPPSGPILKFPEKDNNIDVDNEEVNFERYGKDLDKALKTTALNNRYQNSILIEQTPDGLKINIFDKKDRPMFKEHSAELLPPAKQVLGKIATVIKFIPNYIQISGHTKLGYESGKPGYSAWELSVDRANAARRYMMSVGLDKEQVARIIGKADQDLFNVEDPENDINNRVTVTLLKRSVLAYHKQVAPDKILIEGDKKGIKSFIEDKEKRNERRRKREEFIEGAEGDKEEKNNEESSAVKDEVENPAIPNN